MRDARRGVSEVGRDVLPTTLGRPCAETDEGLVDRP
jgi:hypothetical protein